MGFPTAVDEHLHKAAVRVPIQHFGPFVTLALRRHVSVSVSFWVVRAIGGRPLGELRNRWVRRALAQLDARPVATIAMLRLVLILSPPLNYALALSQVSFAHYFLGSVLGLVAPIALAVALFDHLMELVR